MESRNLQSLFIAAGCFLSAPLARAHVGDHTDTGLPELFVHLLPRLDNWLALSLLLVCLLAVCNFKIRQSRP